MKRVRAGLGLLLVATLSAACSAATAAPSADPADADIALVADDRLTYSETDLTAAPGAITIALTCDGRAAHDVVVETPDGPVQVALCGAGGTSAGTVELAAGDYSFFCSVPGHRRSMEGTLTVG